MIWQLDNLLPRSKKKKQYILHDNFKVLKNEKKQYVRTLCVNLGPPSLCLSALTLVNNMVNSTFLVRKALHVSVYFAVFFNGMVGRNYRTGGDGIQFNATQLKAKGRRPHARTSQLWFGSDQEWRQRRIPVLFLSYIYIYIYIYICRLIIHNMCIYMCVCVSACDYISQWYILLVFCMKSWDLEMLMKATNIKENLPISSCTCDYWPRWVFFIVSLYSFEEFSENPLVNEIMQQKIGFFWNQNFCFWKWVLCELGQFIQEFSWGANFFSNQTFAFESGFCVWLMNEFFFGCNDNIN